MSTAELLRQDGYAVTTAADAVEGVRALDEGNFDLMLLDLRMPGLDGISTVEVLRLRGEGIPILMISGFGTVDDAVRALHLGTDDFLTKPVDPDVLSARVAELLERRPTARPADDAPLAGMVGRSPAMRAVYEAVRQVAPTDATVLIQGETGTGKELVARAIHDASRRTSGPLIPVNCASLAEGILESELFGHVKGAFTHAVESRRGLFEAAEGGTIFLDEVGDMSLNLQQRLLRVLQEREVTPVGATRPVKVDVRVIAATNRDLREEAAAGRFREDLFYRLNVFRLDLPPLRDRRQDIPLLVEAALERLGSRWSGPVPQECSPFALRLLRSHDWPGNVRELFAVVESAAIRAGSGRLEAQHLPAEIRERGAVHGRGLSESRYQGPAAGEDEREAVMAALRQAGGIKSRAAELLGMSRTTLWRKIREYGLEDPSEEE
jgi:DNA-binding NtrC family response regulator